MKALLTLLLGLAIQLCFAQKILVPYRSGNLFGLSDESGKIRLTPQYDHIQWMQGSWFKTSKKVVLTDSLQTAGGKFVARNTSTSFTGLINNGNIVLADEPFTDYEMVAGKCIVARYKGGAANLSKAQYSKYGNHRQLISLFNLQGKNLFPENFKRIQKIDTTGLSKKDKTTARYILFLGIDLSDRYHMFVVDADEQAITSWLVKDAVKMEAPRPGAAAKQILFNISNHQNIRSAHLLDYSSGQFILSELPAATALAPTPKKDYDRVQVTDAAPDDHTVVAESPGDNSHTRREKPGFRPYHILIKDTLFYLTSYTGKHPVTGKAILMEPKGVTQYQPVIVQSNKQFYIVKENKLSTTGYDSLIYYGKYFLAWQHINGQVKAGVINADDSVIVPVEYDSIYADIKYFNLKDKNPAGKSAYSISLSEADSKYNYEKPYPYKRNFSSYITVFKNGKCGVINIKGETIIPLQYQLIARNNLQHSRPMEDEFFIVKQDNKYGLGNFKYNATLKKNEWNLPAPPAYTYIPGFFYPHYYGIKGYKLVGLYDEHFVFKGFANEKGREYFDQ